MTQVNQPQDPAARKAAAMARTRLSEIALWSDKYEDRREMTDAQQAADFELLWPALEAAREGLNDAATRMERARTILASYDDNWHMLDTGSIRGTQAALDALGLGPEAAAGPGDGDALIINLVPGDAWHAHDFDDEGNCRDCPNWEPTVDAKEPRP